MLGLFLKRQHFWPVLLGAVALAVAGIAAGVSTGSFETNNREALRLEREAAKAVTP